MRLLVIDHFFGQDIEALSLAGDDDLEIRTVDYQDLRLEALRILPDEVASGFEAFERPEIAPLRERWARELQQIIEDEFVRWPFDAVVSPSDTFFYVRALPEACHRLGVPLIVVQKETTVTDATMTEHSVVMRRWAPPRADAMTCCSQRQWQFWTTCGAAPDAVTVTGQPRFDFYHHPERWPARATTRPSVLFFSYFLDAYHPSGVTGDEGPPAWADLHRQTMSGLLELGRRGWLVLIKPHPQQDFTDETNRIAEASGEMFGNNVQVVNATEDARDLIVRSDVVVGFQTTALIEALIPERPVVYTAWDPEAKRVAADLIPFPEWKGAFTIVEEADKLAAIVEASLGSKLAASEIAIARRVLDEYLGPTDGASAKRALAVIATEVERFAREQRDPEGTQLRNQLIARRTTPLRLGRQSRRLTRRARRWLGKVVGRA